MEVAVLGFPSLISLMVTWIKASLNLNFVRAQGPCEIRGSRLGLPAPDSPYGLCGRQATTMNSNCALCMWVRARKQGLIVNQVQMRANIVEC